MSIRTSPRAPGRRWRERLGVDMPKANDRCGAGAASRAIRQRLADGRLQQGYGAGVGVESGTNAERDGPLIVDVTYGQSDGDRHAERAKVVIEHVIDSEGTVVHVSFETSEPTDEHAGELCERADHAQVRKHSVD